MKKLLLALATGAVLAVAALTAESQTAQPVATVVTTCGTASYLAGREAPLTVLTNGKVC